ncbi:hypothetical protein AAMO2058_001000000 [Amorphochlora amoebiformis]|uniref:Senescence domain-containing protein n=1 Tax=Amorphochlora amoebiformis TaxID=1561963 RepID=A0A7S0H637_9EUKA|mmetsp:Transcript_6925/g.10733  ORF Transcript_6925/g.10733 Transcript_6925/m.10733 type:complete len:344 (+) Transcript_6925:11-1042(+)
MLARGGRVFGVWLSRRSIYAERSALRLFLIQQRAWKPLCTSSRGSSIPEDKEYKVIEDEEIKEDSEENFQSSGEEKTRGEAGEDDAIAKAVELIKNAIISGEEATSEGFRSGEKFATKGIEATRDAMVKGSPLKLDLKIPQNLHAVLDSTSKIVKEGKRSADMAAERAGEAATGVRASLESVGDRFSDSIPGLPSVVKDLPLTPELEKALETAVKGADRIAGEGKGIALIMAGAVKELSKEGSSSAARLAESFAGSTVEVIRHSLGKDAGTLAEGAFQLAREVTAGEEKIKTEQKQDMEQASESADAAEVEASEAMSEPKASEEAEKVSEGGQMERTEKPDQN